MRDVPMICVADLMNEVLEQIRDEFYCDSIELLHGIEENNYGRLCVKWLPVPNPCDASELLDNITCQVKASSARSEGGDFTTTRYYSIVDIPQSMKWITEQMRVRYQERIYEIVNIKHDHDIATRLEIERIDV